MVDGRKSASVEEDLFLRQGCDRPYQLRRYSTLNDRYTPLYLSVHTILLKPTILGVGFLGWVFLEARL
jgi:hypothetical protein